MAATSSWTWLVTSTFPDIIASSSCKSTLIASGGKESQSNDDKFLPILARPSLQGGRIRTVQEVSEAAKVLEMMVSPKNTQIRSYLPS